MHRKILIAPVSALLVLFLGACSVEFHWPWLEKDPKTEKVQASGKIESQDRTIGAFDRVRLEGIGKLVLDPEIPRGVLRVRADAGILPVIQTTVDQGMLQIREDGIQGPGSWDIEFRVAPGDNLAEIQLGGLGTIESAIPMKTASPFTVILQGLGKISLDVVAPSVILRQQGSGELEVRGKAKSVTVEAQGIGKVDASELVTESADVRNDGVGEVVVYATETLKVRAQGLGAVRFKGHPAQTDVQTEGLTKVTAAD